MFTGIVREIGTVRSVRRIPGGLRPGIAAGPILKGMKTGDSIALDGVCQTVVALDRGGFEVEVLPETLKRTTLGGLQQGQRINLEPDFCDGTDCCGCSGDNMDVILDDEAAESIEDFCPPPSTGTYYPDPGALAAFDGLDAAGDWTLCVNDNAGADTGILVAWSLHFEQPAGDPPCAIAYPDQCNTPPDCSGDTASTGTRSCASAAAFPPVVMTTGRAPFSRASSSADSVSSVLPE